MQENSNTVDYVTEKIWHALQSGCVPIYWGAPNIDVSEAARGRAPGAGCWVLGALPHQTWARLWPGCVACGRGNAPTHSAPP